MLRKTLIGLLAGGLLLAGCQNSNHSPQPGAPAGGGGGGGDDPGGSTTPPAPTASLAVVDPGGSAGPFHLDGLEKLAIAVDCANLPPGPHAVRVAVTGPSGAAYAKLPAMVVAGDDGKARASASLRVRGSTIESYRQTGTWQLVASVDGVQLAAAAIDLQ